MRSQDNSRHFLIIDLFSKLKDMLKFCNMEPLRSLKLLNLFILAKMCSGSSNSQKKIAFPWSCAYGNKNKVTQNEKKKKQASAPAENLEAFPLPNHTYMVLFPNYSLLQNS